jgi:hypothetical protein
MRVYKLKRQKEPNVEPNYQDYLLVPYRDQAETNPDAI